MNRQRNWYQENREAVLEKERLERAEWRQVSAECLMNKDEWKLFKRDWHRENRSKKLNDYWRGVYEQAIVLDSRAAPHPSWGEPVVTEDRVDDRVDAHFDRRFDDRFDFREQSEKSEAASAVDEAERILEGAGASARIRTL